MDRFRASSIADLAQRLLPIDLRRQRNCNIFEYESFSANLLFGTASQIDQAQEGKIPTFLFEHLRTPTGAAIDPSETMTQQIGRPPCPNILVVDDTPTNLLLLDLILKRSGYFTHLAPSGRVALSTARNSIPDLVLMDITMPEMDGYAVCQEMKRDPRLCDVPVIFLSSLDNPEDKVRAFREGGVDYVTKPYKASEIEARIRTHLNLDRQRRQMASLVEELNEVECLRENLTQMIVHDMRSPLCAVEFLACSLGGKGAGDPARLAAAIRDIRAQIGRLTRMTEDLLQIATLESKSVPLNLVVADLKAIVGRVLSNLVDVRGVERIDVTTSEAVNVRCDAALIERVIENLLRNAVFRSGAEGSVALSLERNGSDVLVTVRDQGPEIPPELHSVLFDKFSRLQQKGTRTGAGLGMALCRLAVEAHGGTIGFKSPVGAGSTFWFRLPMTPARSIGFATKVGECGGES
jgi:signal transduction histidine kinase